MLLIGAILIVISEDKKNSHQLKTIGFVIWLMSIIGIFPFIYRDIVHDIKEQGIEEYLNGEIEVIQHADSTYTFLWIDTN